MPGVFPPVARGHLAVVRLPVPQPSDPRKVLPLPTDDFEEAPGRPFLETARVETQRIPTPYIAPAADNVPTSSEALWQK
ncbi:MAG: hypothetical protein M1827_006762 [Pycnora praestabilis]|nr:MAG: hypothetical protein M1827_006762 [Pycnora praestabilis]